MPRHISEEMLEPFVIKCRKMFQEGQTWEPVLRYLKEANSGAVFSIYVSNSQYEYERGCHIS